MFARIKSLVIGVTLLSASAVQAAHADAAPDPFANFEKRGFELIFRNAQGERLSRKQFDAQVKDQPVAMRVDGDKKIVEVTINGAMPEELKAPLKVEPGAPLPAFHLVDLAGKPHRWPREDGKFTLLDFYFSTCGPCLQAIPELNAFKSKRPDIATLAITFDGASESREFLRKRKLTWDVVPDAKALIDAVGVLGYPTVMLIDPAGRLVAVREVPAPGGAHAEETLDAWVSRVMPR